MATKATPISSSKPRSDSDVSVDDLTLQINILKSDIADLAGQLKTFGKTATADAAATAKDTAKDYADLGLAKAAETQKQAEDFIRTQPGTALALAAGVGFFVGLVTSRR